MIEMSYLRYFGFYILITLGSLCFSSLGAEVTYQEGSPWRGVWLRNEHVKAFVSTRPRLRLLHLSSIDGKNLLRDLDDDISGIKTAYLEPSHQPTSFLPSEQTARVIAQSPTSVALETATQPEARIALKMEIRLLAGKAGVKIRHRLKNNANQTRKLGVWSLMAIPVAGRVEAPLRPLVDHPSSLVFYSGPKADGIVQGVQDGNYWIDLDQPLLPARLRTGAFSGADAITYTRDKTTLTSRVENKGTEYSPPGINLLFYADTSRADQFAELEHLGPLQDVRRGAWIHLDQYIEVSPIRDSAPSVPNTDDLIFDLEQGLIQSPLGQLISWDSSASLSLIPTELDKLPMVTERGVQFMGAPLTIPTHPQFMVLDQDDQRSIELTFTPSADNSQRQTLVEIGGSGNGYNLYLDAGEIHVGIWSTDAQKETIYTSLSAPLTTSECNASLILDTKKQEASLSVNGKLEAKIKLRPMPRHENPSAIGGISGNTRFPDGAAKEGDAPFHGAIRSLSFHGLEQ